MVEIKTTPGVDGELAPVGSKTPAPERESIASRAKRLATVLGARPEAGVLLAFVVIVVALSALSPYFLEFTNISQVMKTFAFIAIAAMGAFLVILTGGIDLSVGSVIGLTGLSAAVLSVNGASAIVAILGAMGVGLLAGLLNGYLISYLGLSAFMVTLGMLSIVRGAAQGLTGGTPVQIVDPVLLFLGQGEVFAIPVPVLMMVVIAVVLGVVMRRTVFGAHLYAIGGNEEAARLSGVPVRRVKLAAYAVAALTAAISGTLLTASLGVGVSASATGYELKVIAATVIGGASLKGGEGSVVGALWGAALLGVVTNGLILLGVGDFWQTVSIGLVIIIAVAIDRFRRRGRG